MFTADSNKLYRRAKYLVAALLCTAIGIDIFAIVQILIAEMK